MINHKEKKKCTVEWRIVWERRKKEEKGKEGKERKGEGKERKKEKKGRKGYFFPLSWYFLIVSFSSCSCKSKTLQERKLALIRH